MALSTTNLASPPGPSGIPFLANAPVVNLTSSSPLKGGESVCGTTWGEWRYASDCLNAIDKLPSGSSEVPYTIDEGSGLHRLPQSRSFGNCMIQVEMAGQRVPPSIHLVPDDIRAITKELVEICVRGPNHIGGFAFGSLRNMKGWLASIGGDLDQPMPYYTSFPTVSISTPRPEYMSPGNYDPFMAHLLAQAEFDAAKAVGPGTRMGAKLSARGRRLLQAEKVMEPRGRRIPWWVDPEHPPRLEGPMAQGNATADALAADETAAGVVALPGSGGTEAPAWTQTARRARRKIGMIGEEASHA